MLSSNFPCSWLRGPTSQRKVLYRWSQQMRTNLIHENWHQTSWEVRGRLVMLIRIGMRLTVSNFGHISYYKWGFLSNYDGYGNENVSRKHIFAFPAPLTYGNSSLLCQNAFNKITAISKATCKMICWKHQKVLIVHQQDA